MTSTSGRLLVLLSLLQARRDWPGPLLADRLAVSERTVRRDVDRLRELGYPIAASKGPDGGYRLDAGTELPPLLFDEDQAVALSVALQMATMSGAGIEEASERALRTIRQVMPARLRHRVDRIQVTAIGRPGQPVEPATLAEVGTAAYTREVLRFDYRGGAVGADTTPGPPRRAEPHHLVTRGGRWYLLAWDLDRGDWRTFRLDRMSLRTPNGPRFAPRDVPGGDVAAFMTSKFQGHEGPDLAVGWPCRGEVILMLPAAEVTPYARDGIVEALAGDRCRLVLGSWSWVALAATLAQFDTEVEVINPPDLADAFSTLAARFSRTATKEQDTH